MTATIDTKVATGIAPLDERVGGLDAGGTFLVVGAPGPAKMVVALQFLHAGVAAGDRCLLLTNADAESILGVGRAWGLDLDGAWRSGTLQIIGFRNDFELRALRSIAPEEVLEELDEIVAGAPDRIAVDPGSMLLTGGAKTLLGAAFLAWARRRPATVLATFSVDGDPRDLPSAADWLLNATTARLIVERRSEGLFQITLSRAIPGAADREESVSIQLEPGEGLVSPSDYPARRGADRAGVDHNRLLLMSLGGSHASDLEAWARRMFDADVVSEPFAAVAKVQGDSGHGCVLVHAERRQVRDAVQACRALRPLTRAAIVFASDDAIRSTDRVAILEAGADDCLSGGLDFRELGLRIRQSMASGARPPLAPGSETAATSLAEGGLVSRRYFAAEVTRRANDAELAFFCVLGVTSGTLSTDEMERGLSALVRSEEGDLVAKGPDRCLVLLQGARQVQLGAFLDRLRARLRDGRDTPPDLEVSVLSHPADASKIRLLVETARAESD